MLEALGVKFLDKRGLPIAKGAIGLCDLEKIDTNDLLPALRECHFHIACDVKNPLCGENGCSAVFGPQKGATSEMIPAMDTWLAHYAEMTKEINENANPNHPGAVAAGGLGFAFLSYLPSELCSGIELVMQATDLESHIKDADIVITGEGRLDGQSCMGKAPTGVAKLAKKYAKPVIAVAGGVTRDAVLTHEHGIDAFFPIVKSPCTLADAMNTENAYENLKSTTEEIFRLIKTIKST
jgi:glycerate kinase